MSAPTPYVKLIRCVLEWGGRRAQSGVRCEALALFASTDLLGPYCSHSLRSAEKHVFVVERRVVTVSGMIKAMLSSSAWRGRQRPLWGRRRQGRKDDERR